MAVFGLTLYALLGGILSFDLGATAAEFRDRRLNRIVGWVLIVVAVLFALLWLSEDVPALLAGIRPQSLVDMNLPTNPVHILDLAFFLPGAILVGVMLLRGKPLGFVLAPAMVTFLILTGIPILITPIVQYARAEPAGWGVLAPIGSLTMILTGLLVWLLSTIRAKR